MAVVSLELFKKHVRADDFADDDVYLDHLIAAAEESVITATNRSLGRALVQPTRKCQQRTDA